MIIAPVLGGVTTTEFGGMAAMILKFGGHRFRGDVTGQRSRQRRSFDDDVSITL